jgi:hypothetical protein
MGKSWLGETKEEQRSREDPMNISGIANGMTAEYLTTIDKLYHDIYAKGMPGDTYDRLKKDRGFADSFWNSLSTIKTGGRQALVADEANQEKNINLGLISAEDIATYKKNKITEEADKNKPDPYVYERPQTLVDINRLADEALAAPAPEFNPNLVTDWENKMKPIYDARKADTTTQAKDVWGSMFGQGGGSTYEANKLTKVLSNIDNEKLDKAMAFAQADQGQKYATWQGKQSAAVNTKAAIGNLEANADQFKSSSDWNRYWQPYQSDLNQTNIENNRLFQKEADDRDYARAVEVANKYANGDSDIWNKLFNKVLETGAQVATTAMLTA